MGWNHRSLKWIESSIVFFLYTPDFEITTSPRCHSPGSVICSPAKRFDCVNIVTSLFYPACNDNGEKSCQRNNIDGSQESWIAERTFEPSETVYVAVINRSGEYNIENAC